MKFDQRPEVKDEVLSLFVNSDPQFLISKLFINLSVDFFYTFNG